MRCWAASIYQPRRNVMKSRPLRRDQWDAPALMWLTNSKSSFRSRGQLSLKGSLCQFGSEFAAPLDAPLGRSGEFASNIRTFELAREAESAGIPSIVASRGGNCSTHDNRGLSRVLELRLASSHSPHQTRAPCRPAPAWDPSRTDRPHSGGPGRPARHRPPGRHRAPNRGGRS